MSETPAFFTRDGARFVPTGIGVSPWNGRTIGGVPLAALITHLLDALPAHGPMHTARITLDILGAVPMEPLEAETRIVRDGRSLQLLGGALRAGGRTWVQATMLRIRRTDTPPAERALTRPFPDREGPDHATDFCESLIVGPQPRVPGEGARWVRFLPDLFPGTPLSALERAAMVSDFGSGISGPLPAKDWTFANMDISLFLTRLPRSDWLLDDATSESGGNGVAIAHARLGDTDGLFGHAIQTVFLAPR